MCTKKGWRLYENKKFLSTICIMVAALTLTLNVNAYASVDSTNEEDTSQFTEEAKNELKIINNFVDSGAITLEDSSYIINNDSSEIVNLPQD
ncbi:hypothetical protein [Clostridium oryzae]|nr:hypothetical protein [Clostridium oryzae]